MSYLIDTNILLRSVQPSHSMFQEANDALVKLRVDGEQLALVAQNLYEFWAVATRPVADNGLGLSVTQAALEISQFRRYFTIYGDIPSILHEWESLVTTLGVMGKNAHDARVVAAMNQHGIQNMMTYNIRDFQRYAGILLHTPQDILKRASQP
jgi:predicted nucleic acid-binding protein